MKRNPVFRAWFYFRSAWGVYFTFSLGAMNTLTVTYYLAIENYDVLLNIFPTFSHYVITAVVVGMPTLVIVGYVHFKKSPAYKSDVGVGIEANPYAARQFTNSDIIVVLSLKIVEILTHLSKNEKLSSEDLEKLEEINDAVERHIKTRVLDQKTDMAFYHSFNRVYK